MPDDNGKLVSTDIPLRRAMNALLLDAYVADCKRIVDRWNRDLEKMGTDSRLAFPDKRFNRAQGVYSAFRYSPEGKPISQAEWDKNVASWLPTAADREYVRSCMVRVVEPGKFANWIAPPTMGVNDQPLDFEYVKFH